MGWEDVLFLVVALWAVFVGPVGPLQRWLEPGGELSLRRFAVLEAGLAALGFAGVWVATTVAVLLPIYYVGVHGRDFEEIAREAEEERQKQEAEGPPQGMQISPSGVHYWGPDYMPGDYPGIRRQEEDDGAWRWRYYE